MSTTSFSNGITRVPNKSRSSSILFSNKFSSSNLKRKSTFATSFKMNKHLRNKESPTQKLTLSQNFLEMISRQNLRLKRVQSGDLKPSRNYSPDREDLEEEKNKLLKKLNKYKELKSLKTKVKSISFSRTAKCFPENSNFNLVEHLLSNPLGNSSKKAYSNQTKIQNFSKTFKKLRESSAELSALDYKAALPRITK